jgi:hypothetical protein
VRTNPRSRCRTCAIAAPGEPADEAHTTLCPVWRSQAGTNITVFHNFHDEVEVHREHWWKCDVCAQACLPRCEPVRCSSARRCTWCMLLECVVCVAVLDRPHIVTTGRRYEHKYEDHVSFLYVLRVCFVIRDATCVQGPCQHRPPYFGLVKRAMNRPPHPRDPWWETHQARVTRDCWAWEEVL